MHAFNGLACCARAAPACKPRRRLRATLAAEPVLFAYAVPFEESIPYWRFNTFTVCYIFAVCCVLFAVPAPQSVPAEALAAAAARNADAVTSGCLANAMNCNPRADAPPGAQLVVRPESLPFSQLRMWTEGGFSGTGDSYPRLLWLLQELCWLDGVARKLAYDQAWADAFVRHSIVTVNMTV